ncbi:MAG: tRNA 2-selenouridine(34) synthase MnmH, partial [Planctomycetota bacterium]
MNAQPSLVHMGELERALFDPGTTLLDVRSPSEFKEDHVPGALNVPVLDDAQRAEVGTQYVQGSQHQARLIGASMASANIAQALGTQDVFRNRDNKFLVMCFRGGLRSEAMALVLKEVGFPVQKLAGGYKAYRASLRERLATVPRLKALVVMGPTGSGKSRVLRTLAAKGRPFIDLEAHAGHRGSRFGPIGLSPRRQKVFESKLWWDVVRFERLLSTNSPLKAPPVLLEGESMRIGNCY